MAMSHRISIRRGILTTALLGLVLGGCSFSYSSGSSPSNAPNRSAGKPVNHAHAHTSSGKADNHGKPISRSGSSGDGSGKSISKGDNEPDAPTRVDADDPPTRTPKADPPERTKNPPKRTKVPTTRTPAEDDADADATRRSPASNTTIRAKTKVDDPSASDNVVAPK
jgi:hypothetical protein